MHKKHGLILFLKMIVAIILIGLLISHGNLDFQSMTIVLRKPYLLILSILCLFSGLLISGVRWWILLQISGNKVPLNTALNLQLVGSFFSSFLPGASGGDVVRGIQIFRLLNNGRSTALLSIIADRAFAMLGLISAASAILLFLPTRITQNVGIVEYTKLMKIFGWSIGVLLIMSVGFIGLIVRFSLLQYTPIKLQNYLNPIMITILTYKKEWPTLVLCWIISMLASGIVAIGIVFIAQIFNYAADPLVSAIAGVFANVFSVIPIAPGGMGVGESVFSEICIHLTSKIAPFATIYFTFRIAMLITNIPGMIIFFRYTTRPLTI